MSMLVQERELDTALAYAGREYPGQRIDRDLLRVLLNEVVTKKASQGGKKLALLTATVVRDKIKARDQVSRDRINAYKGAVMKIFSDRSARRRQAVAAAPVSSAIEDPKRKGQYLLL